MFETHSLPRIAHVPRFVVVDGARRRNIRRTCPRPGLRTRG
ncbi:hypothetical protein MGWOODY_Smn2074 [hydrothermal vent metagenome]|uniref:Uncharacterized protein n=1 Tax=hydrothermal vent metagenome TaxID=652676 RepID=A0A160TQP8_9ZZZZ